MNETFTSKYEATFYKEKSKMTATKTENALNYEQLFIGGEWIAPKTKDRIDVYSPTTHEYVGSVPEAREADIDAAVSAGRQAFDDPTGWSHWSPAQRSEALERFAQALRSEERRVGPERGSRRWRSQDAGQGGT